MDVEMNCQDCGAFLYYMSPAEAQRVADNPYNFVVYCARCKKEIMEQLSLNA